MRETWVAAILWSAGLAACAPSSVAAADADAGAEAEATIDAALSASDAGPDAAKDAVADAASDADAAPDAVAVDTVPADVPPCSDATPAMSLAQTSTQESAESTQCEKTKPLPTTHCEFTAQLDCAGNLTLTLTAPAKVYDLWWPKEMVGKYAVTIPAAQVTLNAGKQYLLNFKSFTLATGPDVHSVCDESMQTQLTYDATTATLTLAQAISGPSCSHFSASRTLTMKVQGDLTLLSAEFNGYAASMPCSGASGGVKDHFICTF